MSYIIDTIKINFWTNVLPGVQSIHQEDLTFLKLILKCNWATSLSLFTFMHWRRKWQPTPVFLPGESQGRGEPGGLPSMGSHRVGHDWSDLPAAVNIHNIYIKLVVHMLLCLIKVDFKMLFYLSLIFYIFLEVDNTCKLVKL